jgi:predicted nucleotidyltransferase
MSDMEPVLVQEAVVTEQKSSPLITEYKNEVVKLNPSLIDLRLLGSFGTGNEQKGSDLDPWLVLKELPNLEDLSVLSKKEFEVRRRLSAKYEYPNLARHRATIFSEAQTDIYDRSFALRVGIPHKIGAIRSLINRGLYNPDVKPHPTDLVVTLKEYEGLYDRNVIRGNPFPQRKFARRVVQDMTLYFKGSYITDKGKLDEIIERDYGGSDEAVMRDSAKVVDSISKEVPEEQIYDRELSHQCLFTMEKVVWELSRSYFSKKAFDEWRLSKKRHGGYYPVEIKELVDNFSRSFKNILSSNDLLNSLAVLEKPDSGLVDAEDYYQKHSGWMLEAAGIALKASEKGI